MQKLILTYATGYSHPDRKDDLAGLLRLVRSANRNCPRAHMVVLADQPLPLPHYVEQWPAEQRTINGQAMHAVCARWWDYAKYLSFADPHAMVALLDARDVIVQGDILACTKYDAVTVHEEASEYRPESEPANSSWLERLYGYPPKYQDKHGIACAGVITGQADALVPYIRALCATMSRTQCQYGDDQAAHNHVARTHSGRVVWSANGDRALHCELCKHGDQITTANGKASHVTSKRPPCVVHQYDRVPSLTALYKALYDQP